MEYGSETLRLRGLKTSFSSGKQINLCNIFIFLHVRSPYDCSYWSVYSTCVSTVQGTTWSRSTAPATPPPRSTWWSRPWTAPSSSGGTVRRTRASSSEHSGTGYSGTHTHSTSMFAVAGPVCWRHNNADPEITWPGGWNWPSDFFCDNFVYVDRRWKERCFFKVILNISISLVLVILL